MLPKQLITNPFQTFKYPNLPSMQSAALTLVKQTTDNRLSSKSTLVVQAVTYSTNNALDKVFYA